MDLNYSVDRLLNNGYQIVDIHIDEKFFGNLLIELTTPDHKSIMIIGDRGTYECFVILHRLIIPSKLPISILIKQKDKNATLNSNTTFSSLENVVSCLEKYKNLLFSISEKELNYIYLCSR